MIYEDSLWRQSFFVWHYWKKISFPVYDRNIQQLALEIYKVTKGLAPAATSCSFFQRSNDRHSISQSDFSVPQVHTTYFGQKFQKVFRTPLNLGLECHLNPYLTPMPAISHFVLLMLWPEKRENLSNVLITAVADFSFLKKNPVSSA